MLEEKEDARSLWGRAGSARAGIATATVIAPTVEGAAAVAATTDCPVSQEVPRSEED